MTTTIDKAGRVVIPASMRERAGFTPGSELEVLIDDMGIRLVRKVSGPVLVKRGNRLVAEPTVPLDAQAEIDVAALIEEERNRWP
jgi:AbrB family looped-hinge helix DNA binding protein